MTQIRLVCCHNWSLNLPDETGTAPRLLRLRSGYEEFHTMRVLIGVFLGVILTVGGAYLYDSHNAVTAANAANVERPMVNWDVVGNNWNRLTERARAEWVRLAG
jgi:hypothetical protein